MPMKHGRDARTTAEKASASASCLLDDFNFVVGEAVEFVNELVNLVVDAVMGNPFQRSRVVS